MIDLHSHILPGLDDGAKDFPYAVRMRTLSGRYDEKRFIDRWLEENPQRLLAGDPVRAPHPGKLNWFQKWRRRREAVMA